MNRIPSDTELRTRLAIAHARFELVARQRGSIGHALAQLELIVANSTGLRDRLAAVQRRADQRDQRRRDRERGCI